MNLSLRWEKCRKIFLRSSYLGFFSFFIAGSFFLISSFVTYKNIQRTLEISLKLQALSLESVLQSLLKTFNLELLKTKRDFFSELLLSERWEGVAYILLYDQNRIILLHSNLDLIGRRLEGSYFLDKKKTITYENLTTGEKVFIYENAIKISSLKNPILRIALYVDPVEEFLSYAKGHLYFDLFLSFFLFSGGVASFWFLRKMEKKNKQIEELKNWQFITKILFHEIKNPLASIKGFTQYLLKKSNQEGAKPLEVILKEVLRIEKLLYALFNYSYEREPLSEIVDVKRIIEEVWASLKFLYESVEVLMNFPQEEILVKSDPEKLKSILINLLENASQASLEKGENKVWIDLKSEENYYIIVIRDSGLGMTKEILRQAFAPFFTTKAKGTGLGLTIVKKFCQELNIELKIESESNKGTEVCLRIPKLPL